jgi:hypothetical protein
MNAEEHGASYKDLLYVRRRFITKDHMRDAIRRVVNAIFGSGIRTSGVKGPRPAPRTRKSLVLGIKTS